ncbi:unnamed protein product, partial [Rotaria sp. Silwood1]
KQIPRETLKSAHDTAGLIGQDHDRY